MVEYKTDSKATIAEVIGFARDGSPNVRGIMHTAIDPDKDEKTFDLPINRHVVVTSESRRKYYHVTVDGKINEIEENDLKSPRVN